MFYVRGASYVDDVYFPNNNVTNAITTIHERVIGFVDGGVWRPIIKPLGTVPYHVDAAKNIFTYIYDYSVFLSLWVDLSDLKRYSVTIPPVSYAEYISTTRGIARKRNERALISLMAQGLTDGQCNPRKSFLKWEGILDKERCIPRVIFAYPPEYNLELGIFVKHIEPIIYCNITKTYSDGSYLPIVFKGYNACDQARLLSRKWMRFKDPVYIPFDMSKFDVSTTDPILSLCFDLILSFYTGLERDHLLQLLIQLHNNEISIITADGKVDVTLDGFVPSGVVVTSLLAIIACTTMVRNLLRRSRITKYEIIDMGDDMGVLMERRDYWKTHWWKKQFLAWGYRAKIEQAINCFEQIEFCQTRPVFIGPGLHDYVMCRDPRTVLRKDAISKYEKSERGFSAWMNAVGKGGLALYGNMPILSSFYSFMERNGRKGKVSHRWETWYWDQLGRGYNSRRGKVSEQSRLSFHRAFDIMPHEQLLLEEFYVKDCPDDGRLAIYTLLGWGG